MNTTFINASVVCCSLLGGLLAGVGGTDIVQNIISEPKPYGLQLVELDYKDGDFEQLVVPINTDVVRAKWAAQIIRNGRPICGGGGTAPYTGEKKYMDANTWTDDECPTLIAGDRAIASWTYENVDGKNITISGEVVIK